VAWLLDGNNILGVATGAPRSEGDRERLLYRLTRLRLPRPCAVFFDGPPPGPAVSAEFQMGGIRVLYSGSRTADEAILDRVRPGDTVVTADRDLAIRCRSRRGRAMDPREFLHGLKPASSGREAEKPSDASVDVDEWMEYFKR
jgi:hypothetical protein